MSESLNKEKEMELERQRKSYKMSREGRNAFNQAVAGYRVADRKAHGNAGVLCITGISAIMNVLSRSYCIRIKGRAGDAKDIRQKGGRKIFKFFFRASMVQ
jgi:hypothetical protein